MREYKDELERGMIVQVNHVYPEVEGCLMIIDNVYNHHIRAYITLPNYEIQYWSLGFDEFEVVGAAALLREPLDDGGFDEYFDNEYAYEESYVGEEC